MGFGLHIVLATVPIPMLRLLPLISGAFGTTAPQQATTFENLATENTMTFGNLAQQRTPGFGSPTFGATNQPSFGQPSQPSFG